MGCTAYLEAFRHICADVRENVTACGGCKIATENKSKTWVNEESFNKSNDD